MRCGNEMQEKASPKLFYVDNYKKQIENYGMSGFLNNCVL